MNPNESIKNMAEYKAIYGESLNSKNLKQTNLIEENPEGRQLTREEINSVNPTELTDVVLPVYVTIAAGALIIYKLLYKKEQSFTDSFLNHCNQNPCINCHFFMMNPYLKCAVNPATVLTEQAIDCPDYRPRNDRSSY